MSKVLMVGVWFVWLVDGSVEVVGISGGSFYDRVGYRIIFISFIVNLVGNSII